MGSGMPQDLGLMPMSLKPPIARGSSGVLSQVHNTLVQLPSHNSGKNKSKLNSQPQCQSSKHSAPPSDPNKSEVLRQQLDKNAASQSKFLKDMIETLQ